MVVFLDSPEKYASPETLCVLEQQMAACTKLHQYIQEMDEQIQVNPQVRYFLHCLYIFLKCIFRILQVIQELNTCILKRHFGSGTNYSQFNSRTNYVVIAHHRRTRPQIRLYLVNSTFCNSLVNGVSMFSSSRTREQSAFLWFGTRVD